ncbi:hypothetical protein ACLX1H_008219 [Fusarium chlamydosporum]
MCYDVTIHFMCANCGHRIRFENHGLRCYHAKQTGERRILQQLLIFVGDPQQEFCKWYRWEKPCGRLEVIDIVKCEPALCTRCSSFPSDSPLPFSGTPDLIPMPNHEVERRCEAQMRGEGKAPKPRLDAMIKNRRSPFSDNVAGYIKSCGPQAVRSPAYLASLRAHLHARLARNMLEKNKPVEDETE